MKADRSKERVSQSEAARRLGITPQALGVWAKRPGAPVVMVKGRPFCIWPDFPVWRDAERDRVTREEAAPKDTKLSEAERRYEVARAEKLEFEVRRLRGEMLTVDEAAERVEAMLAQLRSQITTLPQRWAPGLVGCKTVPEVTAKLDQAVSEAMTALSGGA